MALRDLVLFFARRRAHLSNPSSLSDMAKRHGWTQYEVLAFLHSEKEPSKQMLRDMTVELGVTVEELKKILDR